MPLSAALKYSIANGEPPRILRRLFGVSRRLGRLDKLSIVDRFGFRRRYVPDGRQQSSMVEPVHSFQRCQLNCLAALP